MTDGLPRWRLRFLSLFFVIAAIALLGRVGYVQFAARDSYLARAAEQHSAIQPEVPHRGSIRDRNGHPLVTSIRSFQVTQDHKVRTDPAQQERMIDLLAPIVGRSPEQLRLQLGLRGDAPQVLVENLSFDRGVRLQALLNDNWWIKGIRLEERVSRRYPEGNMAPALLGFIGKDQNGLTGIEADFNVELTGRVGHVRFERDTGGGIIPIGNLEREGSAEGSDVVLTIDRSIQRVVEDELDKVIAEQDAEGGSIVVMDPRTGEILGWASRPSYDLTNLDLATGVDRDAYRNRPITDMYEPGSVFKVVGMAAALDLGLVRPDTTMNDPGYVEKGGWKIRNWDGNGNGLQTMTEVLIHSSNIGMVWVSDRLGADRFYKYVEAFGFGQPTRIGLTGEAPGVVRRPGGPDWQPVDMATNSFGQGLMATPIQIVSMMSVIANGGLLVRPTVVKSVVGPDGQRNLEPVVVRRVISPETAAKMVPMLTAVTEAGETKLAMVPGYRVAGKTGTASIATAGGYDEAATIAQFVGFAPAESPRFVVHVKVDRPKNNPWGSVVASPVFSRVSAQLLDYLQIPPDQPVATPTPAAE